MVLAGVLMKKAPGMHVVAATAVALLVFLLSLIGVVPEMVGPVRLDLLLLLLLGIGTATSAFLGHRGDTVVKVQQ
jgi:hypothetical protein